MKRYFLHLSALVAFLEKPISEDSPGNTAGILTESDNEETGEQMTPEELDLLYSSLIHVRAIKQLSGMKWAKNKSLPPVKTILELQQWIAEITLAYHLIRSSINTREEVKAVLKEGKEIFGEFGADMVKIGHDFLDSTLKMFRRFSGTPK